MLFACFVLKTKLHCNLSARLTQKLGCRRQRLGNMVPLVSVLEQRPIIAAWLTASDHGDTATKLANFASALARSAVRM